jgi:hypothetical protein
VVDFQAVMNRNFTYHPDFKDIPLLTPDELRQCPEGTVIISLHNKFLIAYRYTYKGTVNSYGYFEFTESNINFGDWLFRYNLIFKETPQIKLLLLLNNYEIIKDYLGLPML